MTDGRKASWLSLTAAMLAGAALMGVLAWRWNLQAIEQALRQKRAAVRKLIVGGAIPPTQEVVDYLTTRQSALERRYGHWLATITVEPTAEAAADPQLYFQEQFHAVQRTLERLAAARGLTAPEQLGFPKELPPSDTVPRLLVQLAMVEQLAALIMEQGVGALTSFKIEDPEPVAPEGEDSAAFLMRLPLRVRWTSTLPQLVKILGAVARLRPGMDLRVLRVSQATGDHLEVECVVARYLVAAAAARPPAVQERAAPARQPAGARARSTAGRTPTRHSAPKAPND